MATGIISIAVERVNSVFLLSKFGRVPVGFTGKNYQDNIGIKLGSA